MGDGVRVHRVGTITAGLTLVAFGWAFILHLFFEKISYAVVFHFWPLILVGLGIEMLVSSCSSNEKIIYDKGAVALLIIMMFFAMGMAGMETFMLMECFLHF